jgi:restriction system protein
MVMPKQSEMEIPLLEVIVSLGGKARPKEIYPLMADKFPQLTQDDLNMTIASGGNKWTNRIQWVRQHLIDKGELISPERGIWAITDKGRQRVQGQVPVSEIHVDFNLVEIYEKYEEDFKSQLLDRLHELSPNQFEQFAQKLLQVYGFIDVNVTDVGPDGGIDGYGKLKVGLAYMNVAFQCKRWAGNVGSPEVQKFRGAIQGKYEQGIFFTTSDFTPSARNISFQMGAVPIVLLNGMGIVELMMEKGLGVEKRPLYFFYERVLDFLDE